MKPTYEQLEQQRNELAAQVGRLRGALNQSIELLVTALHEPEQITESEIHDLRTIELEQPPTALAALKAQWQAEALGDFYDHLQGMALRNGWGADSDAYNVSEELKYWCQHAQHEQEAGDE
jgi:hypothetical protein